LFDTSFAVALSRLRSQESVAQLRLRSGGEIVYAQLARALAKAVSGGAPASGRADASATAGGVEPHSGSAPRERLAEIEMQAIRDAVSTNRGNMSAAAKQLGISRATLYRKLKPQRAKV
jgi:DNA-binding NtrC family response regulator